jgi:hypothetical protein
MGRGGPENGSKVLEIFFVDDSSGLFSILKSRSPE